MTYFFKKIHIAIAFLSIASIGHAYENYGNGSFYGGSENCFSCQPCQPCQPCCGGKGFVSAEFIWWRAFERGLDTCFPTDVSDSVRSDGKVVSTFSGKDRDPHFEWNPGFRIGAGLEFDCSKWFIADTYTHLHSRAHSDRHDSSYNGNDLRWNLHYDALDVMLGYDSDLCSGFALRPFIGLRAARIDQKLHINAFPGSTSTFSSTSSSSLDLFVVPNDLVSIEKRNKERFRGLGPLLGVEAEWNVGCDLSVYASASVSWLYGNFRVRLFESNEFTDAVDICRERKHLDACLGSADASIGIRWQQCFCNNTKFILQVGLEHHRYFDYNRLGCYGDLSFDGVNVLAGFEF